MSNVNNDTQADTISVDAISADVNNRIALRRLQRNDAIEAIEMFRIAEKHDDDDDDDDDEEEEDCLYYFPEGANDMGCLGYFIGKNDHLEQLVIEPFTPTSGS